MVRPLSASAHPTPSVRPQFKALIQSPSLIEYSTRLAEPPEPKMLVSLAVTSRGFAVSLIFFSTALVVSSNQPSRISMGGTEFKVRAICGDKCGSSGFADLRCRTSSARSGHRF